MNYIAIGFIDEKGSPPILKYHPTSKDTNWWKMCGYIILYVEI
jgi:hypothetical protein